MKYALAAGSVVWLAVLGLALAARAHGDGGMLADLVYAAASRVCHQRPDRSFAWHGVLWPVCGRCAGLYLAAPLGAAAALWRAVPAGDRRLRRLCLAAAVPTAVTLIVEWAGGPMTSATRLLAALPLGASIAYAVVAVAPGAARAIG